MSDIDVSLAHGSFLSAYRLDDQTGLITGCVRHNSLLVLEESFPSSRENIITEDDLYAYVSIQQKALRCRVADEHVPRKAM